MYRGTEEGFDYDRFLEKCGNQTDTICFVHTKSGKVFGMFTPIEWKNADEEKEINMSKMTEFVTSDGYSFVFNFNGNKVNIFKHKKILKYKLKNRYDMHEIVRNCSRVFAMFGGPWAIRKKKTEA